MELKRCGGRASAEPVRLLIVPYGIETAFTNVVASETVAFNRTLWN